MCKKKVLMAASVASMIGQFNVPNIELLQELGYEVHVACNFQEGNTFDKKSIRRLQQLLRQRNVHMYQWDCPRKLSAWEQCLKAYVQLLKITKNRQFSLIHCHSPIGGALARVVAHVRKIPVVYTAHGFHFYKGAPLKNWFLYYPVEKLLSYWTDQLITVNAEDQAFAKKHLNAGRVDRILGVGIDTERFAQACQRDRLDRKKALRERYRIPQDAVLLLSVGELSVRKNHQALLKALAAMKRQDVYCIICGQGELAAWLAAYAKKLGIADRVRLAGYVEQIEQVYQAADIFVFPSLQEGLPAAVMEAMATGLPCVVSDIRGSRELMYGINNHSGQDIGTDSIGGICVRLDRPRELVEALEKLADSPGLRERYAKVNRERSRVYDICHVKKVMAQIYLTTCKNTQKERINDRKKKVQVLLSSYNGVEYISEQIESILCQCGVQVELFIRDDGSCDQTMDLIQEYAKKYPNVHFYQGAHIGVSKSFFDLMAHAEQSADYYAFADQDDVWLPCKLLRAVTLLEQLTDTQKKAPVLYASGLFYADEALQQLKTARWKQKKMPSFGNALTENICTGCTQVFNQELLTLVKKHKPKCGILHDWWMYLSAACFGTVVYDDAAFLYYRQHSANVVGMSNCFLGRWKRRLFRAGVLRGKIARQARDFCRAYGMYAKDCVLAARVADYKKSWRNRIEVVLERQIHRQDCCDDFVYRILFLIGYL